MRAVQLTASQTAPVLLETDAPEPIPGATEVLVQVYAAGVTPTELLWYPTSHNKDGSERTGRFQDTSFPAWLRRWART